MNGAKASKQFHALLVKGLAIVVRALASGGSAFQHELRASAKVLFIKKKISIGRLALGAHTGIPININ